MGSACGAGRLEGRGRVVRWRAGEAGGVGRQEESRGHAKERRRATRPERAGRRRTRRGWSTTGGPVGHREGGCVWIGERGRKGGGTRGRVGLVSPCEELALASLLAQQRRARKRGSGTRRSRASRSTASPGRQGGRGDVPARAWGRAASARSDRAALAAVDGALGDDRRGRRAAGLPAARDDDDDAKDASETIGEGDREGREGARGSCSRRRSARRMAVGSKGRWRVGGKCAGAWPNPRQAFPPARPAQPSPPRSTVTDSAQTQY